jgi:hypothetical protein
MHEANDDHALDDRLQELVDAEADKKAGRSLSDPTLASMSLDQLQREIRTVSRALAKAWGEDAAEGDALANVLREEARLAASLNKPKNYVVGRDVEIKGDLHRQAWGAWGAAGFFLLGTVVSILNREWLVAAVLAVGVLLWFLRGRAGITHLRVEPSGRILVGHGAGWEPVDFAQYSYARAIYSGGPIFAVPSMVIVQRRPIYRGVTATMCRLFPYQNRTRLVFFINSCWRDEAGHLIAAGAMDGLLKTACKKAGYRIERIKWGITRSSGWLGRHL